MVDKEGNEIEDAAMFFANVFGGERFKDYIGEITLMKEMSSVAATVMSDEDGAETEKDSVTSPASPSNTSGKPSADGQAPSSSALASRQETPSRPVSQAGSPPSPSKSPKKDGKKRNKLSPEQRKKLQELELERKKALEERVKSLTAKLLERLRPFVEAEHPGDPNDQETKIFQEKIQREAEDLKLESFGVELLHAIGTVYMMKATSFLKSKKFFGITGFWSRVKEKGTVAKDAWGVIGSALSVQSLMQEMERLQAKGEVDEDEVRALEEDMTGKILLASWRGTRFEVVQVLREASQPSHSSFALTLLSSADQVVDHVLKDREASEQTLVNRAKGLMIMGHIFKTAVPDESDEDRRELERMVAEAATGKSKHHQLRAAVARARRDGKSTPPRDVAEQAEKATCSAHIPSR
ncbi:X-domain of DnaJ-containing-domain-containing protein [Scleroderma citrinum]